MVLISYFFEQFYHWLKPVHIEVYLAFTASTIFQNLCVCVNLGGGKQFLPNVAAGIHKLETGWEEFFKWQLYIEKRLELLLINAKWRTDGEIIKPFQQSESSETPGT